MIVGFPTPVDRPIAATVPGAYPVETYTFRWLARACIAMHPADASSHFRRCRGFYDPSGPRLALIAQHEGIANLAFEKYSVPVGRLLRDLSTWSRARTCRTNTPPSSAFDD